MKVGERKTKTEKKTENSKYFQIHQKRRREKLKRSTPKMNCTTWLNEHHFDRIGQWSLEDCYTLLFMSESMQRKLPGAETAKRAKHRIKERIAQLCSNQKSTLGNAERDHSTLGTIETEPSSNTLNQWEQLCVATISLHQQYLKGFIPNLKSMAPLSSTSSKAQLKEELQQNYAHIRQLCAWQEQGQSHSETQKND